MIVVGIIAIVSAFTIASLSTFRQQSDLDSDAQGVLAALRLARSRTISSENAQSHGVHFSSATYTLFTGRAYDQSATTNEAHALGDRIELYVIALSTSTDVVLFDRLTGFTSTTGTLHLRSEGSDLSRVIRIDASGEATNEATSVSVLNTRLTDTRHLHFQLGWSIENAQTLRLRFADPPNPDIINDIDMEPNAPRSSFAWEGDTSVYGSSEHIRVEAHSLTPSDTLLSVHRLRDQNAKALTISIIDGIEKEIVSYAASGTSTTGIYGGVMTIQ